MKGMDIMIKCRMGDCEMAIEKDICCANCDKREGCDISCESGPNNLPVIELLKKLDFKCSEVNMAILNKIVEILNQTKKLEVQEDELKAKLQDAMEKGNIKKLESEILEHLLLYC